MAELKVMGENAVAAKYLLQKATTEQKNKALTCAAEMLVAKQQDILVANSMDIMRHLRPKASCCE